MGLLHAPAAELLEETAPYMHWRLSGHQCQSGRYRIEKNLLPRPGIESRLLSRSVRNLVAIPTELSLLPQQHHNHRQW
jgi:hypothetical protein